MSRNWLTVRLNPTCSDPALLRKQDGSRGKGVASVPATGQLIYPDGNQQLLGFPHPFSYFKESLHNSFHALFSKLKLSLVLAICFLLVFQVARGESQVGGWGTLQHHTKK